MAVTTSQPQQVLDTAFFEELIKFLNEEIIAFNQVKEAFELRRDLEAFLRRTPSFAKQYPTYNEVLQETLVKLRWVALSALPEAEVASLFEHHFAESFSIPFLDLWVKFRAKVGTM